MAVKKEKLKKTLGYYLPNRFILALPDIRLPLKTDQKEEFTIFIHEYTHLLQNIFTLSGWTSFAYESLKYEALLDIAKNNKKYEVPIFSTLSDGNEKSKIETSINYVNYLYDSDNIPEGAIIKTTQNTINLQSTIDTNFPIIKGNKENKGIKIFTEFSVNDKVQNITINNFVLIESMAYIVEKHYNLAKIKSPAYPYNIISLLFDDTELKDKLTHQIIILYLSLQSFLSDIQFRNIYETVIKNELYKISDITEFANSIIHELSYLFNDGIKSQINTLKKIIGEMSSLLSLYPLASKGVNWLTNISNTFFNNVITDPIKYIKPILERKGTDGIFDLLDCNYFLTSDSTNKLSTVKKTANSDTEGIMFISNVFHFIDYMLFYNEGDVDYNERICPMFNSCSLKKFKSFECKTKPFKTGVNKINNKLCNYGSVSHMFYVHEIPVELN